MASRARTQQRAPQATGAPQARVQLFGGFAIAVDGEPFVMATPRKALPVLAYLLLHRTAPTAREFLAYTLWPDDSEEVARGKLRATLHDLARVLPPAPAGYWLHVDTDNLQWNPAAGTQIDVEEFDRLRAEPERLAEAVALYRGDLLEALYEEWLFPLRERYRNLHLTALAQLVSQARRRRDFAGAIAHAQALLALDPWREDIVRRLIAIRYESGDRAGALAEYERFAQRLRDELQIEPMPETAAVRDAIARGAVVGDDTAQAESVAPAGPVGPALPFVGREAEMALLADAWSRAARGRGGAVFIGGESGVGKSRLGLEFARFVEENGGRIIAGSTGLPEPIPYQSIVEALRSALPSIVDLGIGDVWLASLATLLPELRARLPLLPEPPALDPQRERARLFEALARALHGLARARPLLIVLEDLQWAGEATVAALDFLLQRLGGLPILVVVTYRDDELPRPHPLRRLRRDARIGAAARSVALRPLSLADLEVLVKMLPVLSTNAAALHAASDGNPLFVTQIADAPEALAAGTAPSLRELIAARIARLSDDARTLAEIAALIGPHFSREAVREVSGWDAGAIDDALDELFDRRIVREASGRGFFDYAFTHDVVQETIARGAPEDRTHPRRRRIARVLEELYPERAAELAPTIARQYDLAADAAAAIPWYRAAAERALALGAIDDATAHVARGLELAHDPAVRAGLLLIGETLAARRADDATRARLLDELDETARRGGDAELARTIALRRFEYAHDREDRTAEAEALAVLERLAGETSDARWHASVHYARTRRALMLGDLASAESAARAALGAYESAADRTGVAHVRYRFAEIATLRGDLVVAEALLDDARAAAEGAGDASLSIQALRGAFRLAYDRRDVARCLTVAQAHLAVAIAAGDRRAEAEGHQSTAMALIARGARYREARDHFHAAGEIFREAGDALGAAILSLNRVQLDLIAGDFATARATYETALAFFAERPEPRWRAGPLMGLAAVAAFEGKGMSGTPFALEALELARRMGSRALEASCLEDLACARAADGDIAGAIATMESALPLRDETGSREWTGVALANLGLWYAAAGKIGQALGAIERMLADEPSIELGTPWPQTCYWAAAQVLHAAGDHERSQAALRRALALMRAGAARLEPADRERFAGLRWHLDLVTTAESGVWPDPPR